MYMPMKLAPNRVDAEKAARMGRWFVPLFTGIALGLALLNPYMLVTLLLMGFSGIGQFVPAVLLGLYTRWPTRAGIISGLLVASMLQWITSRKRSPVRPKSSSVCIQR